MAPESVLPLLRRMSSVPLAAMTWPFSAEALALRSTCPVSTIVTTPPLVTLAGRMQQHAVLCVAALARHDVGIFQHHTVIAAAQLQADAVLRINDRAGPQRERIVRVGAGRSSRFRAHRRPWH